MDDPTPRGGILIVRVRCPRGAAPRISLTRVIDRRELPAVTVTRLEEALAITQMWLAELLHQHQGDRPEGGK